MHKVSAFPAGGRQIYQTSPCAAITTLTSIPQYTLLSHLPSLTFPITSIVIQEGFTGVIHRQVITSCKHALACQRRTILIFFSSSQSRAQRHTAAFAWNKQQGCLASTYTVYTTWHCCKNPKSPMYIVCKLWPSVPWSLWNWNSNSGQLAEQTAAL